MASVQGLMKNNLYTINFRADNRQQTRQSDPPMLVRNSQADRYEKERKAQKRRDALSIAGVLATIAMAVTVIISLTRGSEGKVAKSLEQVDIKWVDKALSPNKTTVPIESKSTAAPLRETYERMSKNKRLTPKAKEYAGLKDGAELILEYGYSGTGKTYFSEQFAEANNAMYAMVKYPDLGSPFKDAASMKVDNFFKQIPKMAGKYPDRPIVVCIDEGDALISKVVENSSSTDEAKKLRAAALTGLESVSKDPRCKNVTIFMTTNYHPNNGIVDSTALTRFTKKIEIPLGDLEQNTEMLKVYLKDVKAIPAGFYERDDVINFIQELTDGKYSNREISRMCDEAIKIFSSELYGVADSELTNHKFAVEYMERAKELVGQAASKTCDSMNPAPGINNMLS